MNSAKAFEKIENKIISLLEEGYVPWVKPFDINYQLTNVERGKDENKKSGYTGFNKLFLTFAPYQSPYWGGFNQIKAVGIVEEDENGEKQNKAKIKKGEKGWPVLYPYTKYYIDGNQVKKEEIKDLDVSEYDEKTFFGYTHVWNIEQCVGIDKSKLPSLSEQEPLNFDIIEACQNLLDQWNDRPNIIHGGGQAFYSPGKDEITVPLKKYFGTEEEYYSTIFMKVFTLPATHPDWTERSRIVLTIKNIVLRN